MNRRTALGAIAALAAAPLVPLPATTVVGVICEYSRGTSLATLTVALSDGTERGFTVARFNPLTASRMLGKPLSLADIELV